MTSSTFRCLWKTFQQLSAPIRNLFIDIIILLIVDLIKFCLLLLLVFTVGYSMLYLWNNYNERQQSIVNSIQSERLSDGLMDSFSKYPYVVEVSSAESIKTSKKTKSNEKSMGSGHQ